MIVAKQIPYTNEWILVDTVRDMHVSTHDTHAPLEFDSREEAEFFAPYVVIVDGKPVV